MNYIGIDFGDGTTSLALLQTDSNGNALKDEKGKTIRPREQDILSGDETTGSRTEIPSVLARHSDPSKTSETPIGEKAAQLVTSGWELHSNWKTYPSTPKETAIYSARDRERDAKAFMKAVWEHYCKTDSPPDNPKVAIGVPSDWKAADIEKYREWAVEAGIPNVTILPESTAALLYARQFLKDQNGNPVSDTALEDGILMIDIGSSTTDFTYANGLKLPFEPYGMEFGSRYIDLIILKSCVESLPPQSRDRIRNTLFRKENRELKNAAVFSCRKMKERYFTSLVPDDSDRIARNISEGAVQVGEDFLDLQLWEDPRTRIASASYWKGLLDSGCPAFAKIKTANGKQYAWRELFREYLKKTRENISRTSGEGSLDKLTVVLTGGASRMWFVLDDIAEVFGGETRIFTGTGNERSFSVARGLAWACYAQDKIGLARSRVEKELKAIVESVETKSSFRENRIEPIGDEMAKRILSSIAAQIRGKPASMNTKRKIADFAKQLADEFGAEIADKKRMVSMVKDETVEVLNLEKVKKTTDGLYGEFGRVSLAPSFSSENLKHFTVPKISIKLDLDGIIDGLLAMIVIAIAFLIWWPLGAALWAIYHLGGDAVLKRFLGNGPDDVLSDKRLKQIADKLDSDASTAQKVKDQIVGQLCDGKEFSKTYMGSILGAVKQNLIAVKQSELDALAGFYSK